MAKKKAKKKAPRKLVELRKLKPGPIRHVDLPAQLLDQIGAAYKVLGPYLDTTLEQFEVGFMRDMHPVREIAIWNRIAAAWRSYHAKFLGGKPQPKEEVKKIVGALVAHSTGIDDSLGLGVPADVARKLLACYAGKSQR
ncbi:MAG: hypothetical protein DMF06_17545 [Verrucomicrobia bacterium]|nr:MAG: hypothetical protein DMF06_17545 [Verrucomicrobiota bacterium]